MSFTSLRPIHPAVTHSGYHRFTPKGHGRWTLEEHQRFLQGLEMHGKSWTRIALMIPSRNVIQVRTHAQKFFKKIAPKRCSRLKPATSGILSAKLDDMHQLCPPSSFHPMHSSSKVMNLSRNTVRAREEAHVTIEKERSERFSLVSSAHGTSVNSTLSFAGAKELLTMEICLDDLLLFPQMNKESHGISIPTLSMDFDEICEKIPFME